MQAALKEHRHKAYEDFEAVARDLIARKYTDPARLACIGGSNGGLLVRHLSGFLDCHRIQQVGNMLTRQGAALFGAVVCQVCILMHSVVNDGVGASPGYETIS